VFDIHEIILKKFLELGGLLDFANLPAYPIVTPLCMVRKMPLVLLQLFNALLLRAMRQHCVSGARRDLSRRRRRRSEIMGSGYDASMPISSILLLAKLSNTITN